MEHLSPVNTLTACCSQTTSAMLSNLTCAACPASTLPTQKHTHNPCPSIITQRKVFLDMLCRPIIHFYQEKKKNTLSMSNILIMPAYHLVNDYFLRQLYLQPPKVPSSGLDFNY